MAIAAVPITETRLRHTMVAAKYLTFAHEYQRDIDERRVQKIAEDFDEYRVQMIAVSKRSDGSHVVIDGQHRIKALHLLDPELSVLCQVYSSLSIEEEARLYVQLNQDRKALSAVELFKGRVAAGDSAALHILRIVEEHGYTVVGIGGSGLGAMWCVKALETIYKTDAKHDKQNGVALRKTLAALAEAWTPQVTPTTKTVTAVGYFVAHYRDQFSHDRLVEVLTSITQKRLHLNIDAYRKILDDAGVTGATAHGGRYLLQQYNKGLRSRKLPEWTVGKSRHSPDGNNRTY